ncbi:MAG: hypothetical protein PHZ19_08670 [Candidatus Thermoplasmatota archaeon]|jgi:hypothetical protein|nr:hypothetical protein [Candidatus Thermoplasmatota archaeon]
MQAIGILALAFIGEAIVEYLLKDHLGLVLKEEKVQDLVSKYAAAVVGVALCFLYEVDVLLLVGLKPVWVAGGYIVTGLLIGRGANFVHDFVKTYLTS